MRHTNHSRYIFIDIRHRSISNQYTDNITHFLSLISDFKCENGKCAISVELFLPCGCQLQKSILEFDEKQNGNASMYQGISFYVLIDVEKIDPPNNAFRF